MEPKLMSLKTAVKPQRTQRTDSTTRVHSIYRIYLLGDYSVPLFSLKYYDVFSVNSVVNAFFRMKQYRTFLFLCSCLLVLISSGCNRSDIAQSSQVLAKVDGKEITISYFERQMASLPESVQKLSMDGKGKKALLEGLINREVLYKEAEKKKFDNDVEIKRKLEDLKKELVLNAFIQREVIDKVRIEDKEVQDYFNSHPDEFSNREEIRISQIIVPEQKDADAVLEKLKANNDFGELAAKYSTDKATALRKGDVGFFMQKQLPAEIQDSVFKMKVGEISGPYKMAGGYEIYKITDRKVVSYSFDKIKDALKTQLLGRKTKDSLQTLVDNLKKDVKIQMNEALLK